MMPTWYDKACPYSRLNQGMPILEHRLPTAHPGLEEKHGENHFDCGWEVQRRFQCHFYAKHLPGSRPDGPKSGENLNCQSLEEKIQRREEDLRGKRGK